MNQLTPVVNPVVIHLLLFLLSIHLDSQMRLHYRICAVSRQISAVCRIYICVGRPVRLAQIGHTLHITNESSQQGDLCMMKTLALGIQNFV